MSSKIALGVAVFAVGVGAALYYSAGHPTSAPVFDSENVTTSTTTQLLSTEGWKTCRNVEYGYELKYPPEWHVFQEQRNHPPLVDVPCEGVVAVAPHPYNSTVSVAVDMVTTEKGTGFVYEGMKSLEDLQRTFTPEQINQIEQHFTVDEEPAVSLSQEWGSKIIAYHNMRIYYISLGSVDAEVGNTILSTFHFID